MLTRKSILIRAAILALLTLTALELALQLAFPLLPIAIIEQMPQYRARMGFRLDAEHGVQEYPAGETVNYEISGASGDLFKLTCLSPDDAPPFDSYRVSFQRDGHGFRNPEPWPDKVQVVVLGDSFTAAEAIVTPYWQGLSDSMLVFGLPGSGTLQQQRLLEAFALPRDPEIVVLAYFAGNDLQDNLAFLQKTRAETGNSSGHNEPKAPLDYSVLFNIAYAIRNNFCAMKKRLAIIRKWRKPSRRRRSHFTISSCRPLRWTAKACVGARCIGSRRNRSATWLPRWQARGSQLILMYIPQKAEVYWELLSDDSKTTIFSGSEIFDSTEEFTVVSANLAAQRNLMSELSAGLGIAFLDLTLALGDAISDGAQPYFFGDTHWNQTGHNIARIALLDLLNQSNLDM